jgi:hypothetical protein|eukprot:COSAG06_NODE_131_length_22532_cov_12.428387_2_plen_340_part_00
MVMEEGSFMSDDGAMFQVGKNQVAGDGWSTVNFHGTGFAAAPVTIATIQTFHGQSCYNDQSGMANRNDRQQCDIGNRCSPDHVSQFGHDDHTSISQCFGTNQQDGGGDGFGPGAGYLKTRLSRPTIPSRQNAAASYQLRNDAQQFYVALENGAVHGDVEQMEIQPEMVGWAAFAPHHGSMGEVTYEAGRTPLSVTEQPYTIQYSGFFRTAPKFFASIATYHGTDSAELRRGAGGIPCDAASCTIIIEEETCNAEQEGYTHPNGEEVGYFAMMAGFGSNAGNDQGGIRARPIERPGSTGLAGTGNHVAVGETGDVSLTADWITVSLDNYYFSKSYRPVDL